MHEMAEYAASESCDFYDECRDKVEHIGKYTATVDEREIARHSTRALIQKHSKDIETDGGKKLAQLVGNHVNSDVRRVAGMTVAHNTGKDPSKPGWARVPNGDTCGWCLMLASFGAHYNSEETAGHSHTDCNCTVTPLFPGQSHVAGYHPDEMYGRYKEIKKSLGANWEATNGFDALTEKRRAKLVEEAGSEKAARDKYARNVMAREIAKRDPDWFEHGTTPEVTFENSAVKRGTSQRQRDAAARLSKNGIRCHFRSGGRNGGPAEEGLRPYTNLDGGLQLYVPEKQRTEREAIKSAIAIGKPKKRLARLVVDFSQMENATNEGAIAAAEELADQVPGLGGLSLILKDGSYLVIR